MRTKLKIFVNSNNLGNTRYIASQAQKVDNSSPRHYVQYINVRS